MAMAVGNTEYLHYMTKASYYDKPVIGPFIRSIGAFRVDPEKGYLSAIREAMQFLKNGEKVCIFPEGTRNRTGGDLEGKAGAAMIAARMHVPVVPTKIENSRKFFRYVHVTFGEPIYIDVRRAAPAATLTMRPPTVSWRRSARYEDQLAGRPVSALALTVLSKWRWTRRNVKRRVYVGTAHPQ